MTKNNKGSIFPENFKKEKEVFKMENCVFKAISGKIFHPLNAMNNRWSIIDHYGKGLPF